MLIGSGILRQELIMAYRTHAAPRANRFKFKVCSVGPETTNLVQQWERKLPKTYGKTWRPLGKTVGSGGHSQVELVEDLTGKRPGQYALKRLRSAENPQARTRFKTEVEATRSIKHSNVLEIYDFDLESSQPYYVAEYCEGGSLQKRGTEKFKGNLRESLTVILPVLDGLIAVHQSGIIHRDLKPSNILFRKDGTLVIADFGICHVVDGEPVTFCDEAVGSRHYIAPEMEAGNRALGEPTSKTDVYSLGKVLFWMVSGGRIFDRENHRGTSLTELFGDQKFEHVHALFDGMTGYEPKQRWGSDGLRSELLRVLSLVERNFAPLFPSIGIRCRFCGIGKYSRYARVSGRSIPSLGLSPATPGGDVGVLRCPHCGHVELFQFSGIENSTWWEKQAKIPHPFPTRDTGARGTHP